MTSSKYTQNIKKLLAEAENQFTSTINTKMPGKEEQSDTLVSPAIEHNFTDESQQEKAALTAKAMEKVKQSLEVSDELQSILNEIDKINKDVNSNKWQLNDKDNTAILPSKNAQIFKQNNYLCLSYNNKVELFNSVSELHDFLRKHNIPLPQNIKLHEATVTGNGKLATLLQQNHPEYTQEVILTPEEREERAEKAYKPLTKKSKEDYILQMKKDDLGIKRVGSDLYIQDIENGGMKRVPKLTNKDIIKIKWTAEHNPKLKDFDKLSKEWDTYEPSLRNRAVDVKKECGATVGGSLGPAVQYTGKKLNEEEELQEIKASDKGWLPGIMYDVAKNKFLNPDEVDPKNPNHMDWTNVNFSRADILAPMWFKWVATKLGGKYGVQFHPEKDANFEKNLLNFVKTKHNPTTRAERENTTWRKSLWDNMIDKKPWLDSDKREPNPNYGEFTVSADEIRKLAKDFKDKGYGDLLNGLDPNDPDLLKKFHPIDIDRPTGRLGAYRKPHEMNQEKLSKVLYPTTINKDVRRAWYNDKPKGTRMDDEAYAIDYLAKKAGLSSEDYYKQRIDQEVMPVEQDSFQGLRGIAKPRFKAPEIDPNLTIADLQNKAQEPVKKTTAAPKKAPGLSFADQVKQMQQQKAQQLANVSNIYGKKEGTSSLGKAFLELRKQNKDIPLKEDDSPADFATGQSAIASDMSAAVDAASGASTAGTTDTSAMNTGDYTADMGAATGAPFNNTPGFGDINIDAGGGDYSPDQMDPMAAPAPNAPEEEIIDVLVDENDPTKIKVKVKNKETGKVTTKNLSEIDA